MGEGENLQAISSVGCGPHSPASTDNDAGGADCRVCHCVESDKIGDAALGFLGISPPMGGEEGLSDGGPRIGSGSVEFIGPGGEVFVCRNDLEMGPSNQGDSLIDLGCSCKNDLALVHYACALKWFVNHGSTLCEICGNVAKNVKVNDLKKVVVSLREYEALKERTASGDPNPAAVQSSAGIDPDAIAAIRRQRLSEISLFFGPRVCMTSAANNASSVLRNDPEQPVSTGTATEAVVTAENPATKWAVEGTGILLAVGLLTATLAWLLAPRVGKKTAKSGLHILLAGVCALTVVIFFRFVVVTRIKYGPARYWAILFVFWFLVFGIWASRTHGSHST